MVPEDILSQFRIRKIPSAGSANFWPPGGSMEWMCGNSPCWIKLVSSSHLEWVCRLSAENPFNPFHIIFDQVKPSFVLLTYPGRPGLSSGLSTWLCKHKASILRGPLLVHAAPGSSPPVWTDGVFYTVGSCEWAHGSPRRSCRPPSSSHCPLGREKEKDCKGPPSPATFHLIPLPHIGILVHFCY